MRVPTLTVGQVGPNANVQEYIQPPSTAASQEAIRVAQAGAGVGQALAGLGNVLQQQEAAHERFATMRSFSAFQRTSAEQLAELKRDSDPAQNNFTDVWSATYNNSRSAWLDSVPDALYEEFAARSEEYGNTTILDARAFQYERTDEYFRTGINDAVSESLISLDQDGSAQNLDAQVSTIASYIAASDLPEAEKEVALRQAIIALSSVSYKAEVRNGNLEAYEIGVGQGPEGTAIDLLRNFDGRLLENGLDYDQNEELLATRARLASSVLVEAIGSVDRCAALPDRARAALISLVDDLEQVPDSIVAAVNSGRLEQVADAVEALGGERRATEADIIRGNEDMPAARIDSDPRYQWIPYEDRLTLRADAERESAAQLTAQAAERDAREAALRNRLYVDLFDGNAGETEIARAREAGWLTDIDDIEKAYNIIEDQTQAYRDIQQGAHMLENGFAFDPTNTDHKRYLNAMVGEAGIGLLREGNMDYVTTVLSPIVDRAEDIPTDVSGLLQGMARSDNAQQREFAYNTLMQLQDASQDGFNNRLPESVQRDVEFWRTNRDYYTPQALLETMRGGNDQESRNRTTALREEAQDLLASEDWDFNIVQALEDNPGWRFGGANITAGQRVSLNLDFNRLFEAEYARDGNADLARDRAVTAMTKVWGVTDIGGQQSLMKYPPEMAGYPAVEGGYGWIEEQARELYGIPDRLGFELIADDRTRNEYNNFQAGSDQRPSYQVFYYDDDGVPHAPNARVFFEITPEIEQRRLDYFAEEQRRANFRNFMQEYNRAQAHSLMTGIAIPPELNAERDEWYRVMGEQSQRYWEDFNQTQDDRLRNRSPEESSGGGGF